MANTVKGTVATRKLAVLASDGVDGESFRLVREALLAAGASVQVIGPRLGTLETREGELVWIDQSLLTTSSVLFDAVYVPGGAESVGALLGDRDALDFVAEAYRHCKPISATSDGVRLLEASPGVLTSEPGDASEEDDKGNGHGNHDPGEGVVLSRARADARFVRSLIGAMGEHRFWNRARKNRLDAAASGDETRGRAPFPLAPRDAEPA
jgi:catalase